MTEKEMERKTRDWSLRLALALDDENWEEVSAVCGEINTVYCDLAYGPEKEQDQ